jgi:hypothetical protein
MPKKIFLAFTILLLYGTSYAQQLVFDIENSPAPLFRDPIYDGAADPSVIWNNETGEWWIFYTQRRAATPSQGVSWCYGTRIGIAASADSGRTWYYKGTCQGMDIGEGKLTFWAPEVLEADGEYHMFVTFIKGIYHAWGGARHIIHLTSKDLFNWTFRDQLELASNRVIDPGVIRLDNGLWRLWYKDEAAGSVSKAADSPDLFNWKMVDEGSVTDRSHEAPNVFFWKDYYWLLGDTGRGIPVYRSADGNQWESQGLILIDPGQRVDDGWYGQHPDIVLIDDRAFIFYFVHPGRRLFDNPEYDYNTTMPFEYKRTSLQVAELEVVDGKLICERDKYFK